MVSERLRFHALVLCLLSALAVLTYWPMLNLPLVSDDYIQITRSRQYGPVSGWGDLLADALYRCRATSLVLTHWTEQLFGPSPALFSASSLLLHLLNTLLIYALGRFTLIGWRTSALAAAFFAVHERHHEAVIWYAALPELLVFFFALLCVLCWGQWLSGNGQSRRSYLLALLCFALALLSKESAVIVVALLGIFALAVPGMRTRAWVALAPFVLLAVGYTALNFFQAAGNQHHHDGTFSLMAPFPRTVLWSSLRLLWVWGALSIVALLYWRPRHGRPLVFAAALWMVLALVPYSFLTYMPQVPSRHTYLASAGLALLVATALVGLWQQRSSRTWIVLLLLGLITVHNIGYLWTKKRPQFLLRAQPTEALVDFAAHQPGPIFLQCFPYRPEEGRDAVLVRLGAQAPEVIIDPREAHRARSVFCYGQP